MTWHRGRGKGRGGGSSWRGRNRNGHDDRGGRATATARRDDEAGLNGFFGPRKRQRLTLNGVASKAVATAWHDASKRTRSFDEDGRREAPFDQDNVMPVRLVSTRHGTKAFRNRDAANTCSESIAGQPALGESSHASGSGLTSLGKRKQPAWMARAFEDSEGPPSKAARRSHPHDTLRSAQDVPSISQLADRYGWRAPSTNLHHPSPLRPLPLDRFSTPVDVADTNIAPHGESLPFCSSPSLAQRLPVHFPSLPYWDSHPPRRFSSPSSSLENHRPLGGSLNGSFRGAPRSFGSVSLQETNLPSVSPPPLRPVIPPGFWKATPTMPELEASASSSTATGLVGNASLFNGPASHKVMSHSVARNHDM